MRTDPGTYILILRNDVNVTNQVGRWGWMDLETGYYLYVGSAFGTWWCACTGVTAFSQEQAQSLAYRLSAHVCESCWGMV